MWGTLFRRLKMTLGVMFATPAAVFLVAIPFIATEESNGKLPEENTDALIGAVLMVVAFGIPAFFLIRSARRHKQEALAKGSPRPSGACPTCGSRKLADNTNKRWTCAYCGSERT